MIAEVISIGDEITSGQRLDTNSQWISQQLGDLGIKVIYHSTVADSMTANVEVFQIALKRAEIIICTGGLGPTADDLTRVAIAEALGVELYHDADSFAHIESLFAKRNRPMPEQNKIQADFPVGTVPIFNKNGSAPGIFLEKKEHHLPTTYLMAFPGVPAELKEMFTEFATPKLFEILGDTRKLIVHKPIRCFGIGESDLESRLPDLIKRGRDPQVGITASAATITLRISAEGKTEEECQAKIDETESVIRETLGEIVFGTYEDQLEDVLVRELMQRDQTLAIAEVGTGGFVSSLFAKADPLGKVFVGGWIARNTDSIQRLSGTEIPIDRTAEQLAKEVRQKLDCDYAIAIDAFPDDENDELQIAVATETETVTSRKPFAGHPSILLPRAAKQAMNELRLWLLKNG